MLTKCPECELQVSDKAVLCPHCGFPLKPNTKVQSNYKSNKRKRLPNGFGQISEIKNKRLRNPFRAMVTTGKAPDGRPICKPLKPQTYFRTYNDAYAALIEYNRNPYDLSSTITLKELYDRWSSEHFKKLGSASRINAIQSVWRYCSSLYSMPVSDIRVRHIKGCIENGKIIVRGTQRSPTANMKIEIKELFNMLFDYAVEYEIVEKNYSRMFKLPSDLVKEKETSRKSHIPFTDEEMEILWNNLKSNPCASIILIQCYSGWRPQELCLLKVSDVDLENWTFRGGMKTEAGTERVVPIHTKIRELVKEKYQEAISLNSEYLINYYDPKRKSKKHQMSYFNYKYRFSNALTDLNLNPEHRPHDGRVHFVTVAKKYAVDEYAIKYIVGHTIYDVTEKIYTKRDVEWLKREIEKIK